MVDRRPTALILLALLFTVGCDDDDASPTGPIPESPTAGAVFGDAFAEAVTFQAFADSKLDAVQIDETVAYEGSSSLKVTVPGPGDASGFFAGGAFTSSTPWDLSQYDVLTFWARADRNATLNVAGLANDNTGTSLYMVETTNLNVSGVWRKFFIPMPDPSILSTEAGLFYFAEGHENDAGYNIWFDNIQFEKLDASLVRASMTNRTITIEPGSTDRVTGLTATLAAGGVESTVSPMPRYYTFSSSDPAVASVAADGTITAGEVGTAVITAKLGELEVGGSVNVTSGTPLTEPAPTPTRAAADVISLYSNAYTNVTVDTWSAPWDNADVEDTQIAGDDVKLYTNLTFAGIEFTSQTVDASGMDGFHMDIWTPDGAPGEVFKIKLVDFGANGVWSGGDDVEHEISIVAPTLKSKEWVSIDVPLSDFAGMTTRAHVAQLIISGNPNTVYVDNVYFFKGEVEGPGGPPAVEPAIPAPTPDYDAGDVVSLFSDAYTDVAVDTWSAEWDGADVADVTVAGNAAKKYTNLVFAGIEFTSATVDATGMTHFRMDIWTPDATDGGEVFKIKLVDFGANGVWSGGDDVEHELELTAATTPAIGTGAWYTLAIPLEDFTGLTTRGALAQLIISGDPNTVYVDNVLFFKDTSTPAEAAPAPTHPEADVISFFSDAYTDVTVDTWSAEWDAADVEDVLVAGDAVKKYTNLSFAGIEFTSQVVDGTEMTHLRFDLWTPDPVDGGEVFKVKLVDFGANGVWSGGDDVEHEITLDAAYTTPLATGSWVSFDIPLSEFTGLTTRGSLAQLIISGDL
ncbi:MAG TPA: hypothetical protein VLA43_18220, partial [Longimicrobiales bacterium]|nr:hypothetical protein [Longimicrobiales bacterium]